nr:MAG TPA_asm: hypothetical protein [Caudoviricetes sp.]
MFIHFNFSTTHTVGDISKLHIKLIFYPVVLFLKCISTLQYQIIQY